MSLRLHGWFNLPIRHCCHLRNEAAAVDLVCYLGADARGDRGNVGVEVGVVGHRPPFVEEQSLVLTMPLSAQSASKSAIVKKRTFGECTTDRAAPPTPACGRGQSPHGGCDGRSWEGDHRFVADAQHLLHQRHRMSHRLQRQRHDDVVEGIVVEALQPCSRSNCRTLTPFLIAASTLPGSFSTPSRVDTFFHLQELEQRTITAAEVEDALALLYPAGNDVEIETAENFRHVSILSR